MTFLVLRGDSAHSTPHVAHGAATSVGYAAALATCLSFLSPSRNVNDLLGVHEEARSRRSTVARVTWLLNWMEGPI